MTDDQRNEHEPGDMAQRAQPHRPQQSVLSIALLFYLVTLAAILSASLKTLVVGEQITTQVLVRGLVAGGVCGSFAGLLAGLFYFKSWSAAAIGVMVGLLSGMVAGGAVLVQDQYFLSNVVTVFAGCWLLIVVMLIAARFQADVQF